MRFKALSVTFQAIVWLLFVNAASGQQPNPGDVKKVFSEILIGKGDFVINKSKFHYEQKFVENKNDTLIYTINDDQIISFLEQTDILITKDKIFLRNKYSPFSSQLQKIIDFKLATNESWEVDGTILSYGHCTIMFEQKNYDVLIQDTIYQYKINGINTWSHTPSYKRIYATKKMGIIRIDVLIPYNSFSENKWNRAIFVSNDYIKRSRLKKYYEEGKLKEVNQ